jgi:type II secretory ATPase GspE/PulE/Tfp pilus assembly ATPase PilB-like protein
MSDDEYAASIVRRDPLDRLAASARRLGLEAMAVDGLRKAEEGLASVEEIMAVLQT